MIMNQIQNSASLVKGDETKQEILPINELLSYRISRVAGSLSQSAALLYRRDFDFSLGEWRTVALLGAQSEPLTLNRLARRAGLDKAQMSRVIKGLVERNLVNREHGAGRTTELTLSEEGQRVYANIIRAANDRDRRLRRHLGAREEASLMRALETISNLARVMKEEETHLTQEEQRS